ncbi:MAG TPA: nuclear transport factor 2 family protein [Anaerolineales bacterium]|nr:nuclear transport factor 2 family protein [Anaerolineales bacterium]
MNTKPISRLRLSAFAVVTSILLGACISSELASVEIASPDSLSTIDTFHFAINSDDVDTALTLFAEDAIIIDGASVIQGKDEIRNWLLYSQRMTGLRLTKLNAAMDGEKVSWLDIAHDGPTVQYRLYVLRWEALIRQGKIHSLSAISG